MPRVLRIITRLNIGGPAVQAARLTTELRHLGYETVLVHGALSPAEGDMRDLLPPDADVRFVPALRRELDPLRDLPAYSALARIIGEVDPDIVHTHMAKAGLLGRVAARRHRRGCRPRIVHTYHGHVLEGYFNPIKTAAFIRAERLLAHASDALVAISPRIRDQLAGRFRIAPADRFRVIPLGFDLAPFAAIDDRARSHARRTLEIEAGALVLTTAGRLTAIKNYALLLMAFRRVLDRLPSAVLLIAGDGELRADLEARAAALRVRERVRFLGWRRDLAPLYGASDLFVLTSDNEGTPVALIEAMAAGVPGIATDVGGVADVVVGGVDGLLVRAGDAADVAAAILALAGSPGRRRTMGERARESMLGRFTLGRLVDDIDRLYRELLAG